MATLSPLRIPILAIDKFSNKFSKIQKRVNKFSKKMKAVGSKITTGFTAPVMLAGAAIFKSGYQFDKFMNIVQAKSTVAGKSIDDLRAKALELGSSTSFSHIQAAEAMGFLAQAGYKTGQTFDAILPTLNLATATNIELGQSADWLTNIMGGFQIEAKDAGKTAALLAMTSAKANVSMEDLAYTFADAAPVAKMYGANITDVAAATGFLGNIGIKGTKAGTALKNMFLNLATQTPKATAALKKMGIQVDDNGKMRDFTSILQDMANVLPKMKQKDAIEAMTNIFGKRSISGVAGLTANLQKGNGEFLKLADSLKKVGENDLAKMVKIMRQGSVGAWDDMVSAIQGFGQAIADAGLVKMLSDFFRLITKGARVLAKVSPLIIKLATIFTVIAAAMGPVLVMLGSLLPVITAVATKIMAAGGVIALFSNPIGWVVAGIGALIAVVVILWKELEPVRRMIGTTLTAVFNAFRPLLISFRDLFYTLVNLSRSFVTALAPLATIIGLAFGTDQLTMLELFAKVLAKIVNLVTWTVEKFTVLIDKMGEMVLLLQSLTERYDAFAEDIIGNDSAIGGFFNGVLDKVGLGDPTVATSAVTKSAAMANETTNNAKVQIDFSNLPAGATVTQEGKNLKIKKITNANNGAIFAGGI